LNIQYLEKNISEILSMTVDEARFLQGPTGLFKTPNLRDVGLGHHLGQSITLSGGERSGLNSLST
jgi:excinuclease UvrABC ATPase subunit